MIHFTVAPNTLAEHQITSQIDIHADCKQDGYSGLMGLLHNVDLLALKASGARLHPQAAGYLLSCVDATAATLGYAYHALCAIYNENANSEYITPNLLADFGVMLGELFPHFVNLISDLATDNLAASNPLKNPHP